MNQKQTRASTMIPVLGLCVAALAAAFAGRESAVACGEAAYADGWREGSWAGFNEGFTDPPPWYFRTLASWVRLFSDHGLQLRELRAPLQPTSGKPASLILMGSLVK